MHVVYWRWWVRVTPWKAYGILVVFRSTPSLWEHQESTQPPDGQRDYRANVNKPVAAICKWPQVSNHLWPTRFLCSHWFFTVWLYSLNHIITLIHSLYFPLITSRAVGYEWKRFEMISKRFCIDYAILQELEQFRWLNGLRWRNGSQFWEYMKQFVTMMKRIATMMKLYETEKNLKLHETIYNNYEMICNFWKKFWTDFK